MNLLPTTHLDSTDQTVFLVAGELGECLTESELIKRITNKIQPNQMGSAGEK